MNRSLRIIILSFLCLSAANTVQAMQFLRQTAGALSELVRPVRRAWYYFKKANPTAAQLAVDAAQITAAQLAAGAIVTKTADTKYAWVGKSAAIAYSLFLAKKSYSMYGTITGKSFYAQPSNGITTFRDIGGAIQLPVRLLVDFLQHPQGYRRAGAAFRKGILMYGPPGTGKTMLARAIANEAHVPFFQVSSPDMVSKWLGQSSENIRDLFQTAREAAEVEGVPFSIVFFDEFDAIGKSRDSAAYDVGEMQRVVNTLLTELDGFDENSRVLVIAATNHVEGLDKALTRNGRFSYRINVPMPDEATRTLIARLYLQKINYEGKAEDLAAGNHERCDALVAQLAQDSDGFSPADIATLIGNAATEAVFAHNLEIRQQAEDVAAEVAGGVGLQFDAIHDDVAEDAIADDEEVVVITADRLMGELVKMRHEKGLDEPDHAAAGPSAAHEGAGHPRADIMGRFFGLLGDFDARLVALEERRHRRNGGEGAAADA